MVCGGFGLPIARDMCQKVMVVASNDLQSLYVANNVCSAVQYFRKLGGNVGVAGIIINKDDGTGEVKNFAEKVGIPVLTSIPAHEDIRRKSASYEIIGKPGSEWASLFSELASNVATAPPVLPNPLIQDDLLNLFSSDVVGRDYKLEPAELSDLTGVSFEEKKSLEVIYDAASEQIIDIKNLSTAGKEKVPCGSKDLIERARAQNKSEIIDQYKKDSPIGPHDQPQSMCPAFGSLRVGLRMNRVATILSGSACCVYGLTFTSHFYGARRSVGYVPFNSETLVTGKLFEDIKESVEKTADPDKLDAIVVINLCVPTASGVPLQLLPKVINGVRIIGIDVPGFGVPTHAEAKDILASAMLKFSKTEITSGPVKKSLQQRKGLPLVTLVGSISLDPMSISSMLEPLDLEVGAIVPTRQWRELYTAFEGSLVLGCTFLYFNI